MASERRVLFSKDGVFIHTTVARADEDALVAGRVFLIEKPEGLFIEWKAKDECDASGHGDSEWTVVDTVGYKADKTQDSGTVSVKTKPQKHPKYVINFEIKDLKSFKRSQPSLGWSYLIFILKCGTTYPALHFHQGGTKALIKELEKYLIIKRSPSDTCLYLVREHDPEALSRSFDQLKLFEEQSGDILSKFIQNPYTATLGGFSKVTNFLKDALLIPENDDRPREEIAVSDLLSDDISGIRINNMEEPGFEMITTRELPPRPTVKRSDPLTTQQWSKHMDKDGRVVDVEALKEIIFRGGVDSCMRIEVWKFLLGYYKWDSTYHSRTEQRKRKVDDYFRMKLQWKSVSEEQEKRFSAMRDRKSLIDKDVTRTDRTHHFFQGEDNPNIMVLNDILMTYCMYNFDLGYVQGMSDLLAPILVVMENEVDAFWCFAGFMELVCHNFDMDQEGMKKQLLQVKYLVGFYDPQLHNHFESHDSDNMYFCFRWLLIVFKREFAFKDIMRLWEVYWTGMPCKNFHLVLCLAILDKEKNLLIENNFGFTEILKHINDMSLTIDKDEVLTSGEAIYLQLKACKDLPNSIREIIGLELLPEPEILRTPVAPPHRHHNGVAAAAATGGATGSSSGSRSAQSTPPSSPARSARGLGTQATQAATCSNSPAVQAGREDSASLSTTPDENSIELLADRMDIGFC